MKISYLELHQIKVKCFHRYCDESASKLYRNLQEFHHPHHGNPAIHVHIKAWSSTKRHVHPACHQTHYKILPASTHSFPLFKYYERKTRSERNAEMFIFTISNVVSWNCAFKRKLHENHHNNTLSKKPHKRFSIKGKLDCESEKTFQTN